MATSAQIAFFDLAYTDEYGEIVMAATPNMDSAYYQVAYDAGAESIQIVGDTMSLSTTLRQRR